MLTVVDARSVTVPLLQELVWEDDDQLREDELDDEQEADASAEVSRLAVQPCKDVDGGLAERDDQSEDCEMLGQYVVPRLEAMMTPIQ
ncbi:hypothetical protein CVT25_015811 [Psilocybe cyanescens]|uniref:Uncharacterized protein n=1 Tax=Psilocybe cyanescens TaxID=93625 RepID=A0A409XJP0_PSICY|nr:hypothetical protein CVT25_015811 [Psilocybe cyanescens]